jgi:hypothetical protein
MKPKYEEERGATKNFERTMAGLSQVMKHKIAKKIKKKPKEGKELGHRSALAASLPRLSVRHRSFASQFFVAAPNIQRARESVSVRSLTCRLSGRN